MGHEYKILEAELSNAAREAAAEAAQGGDMVGAKTAGKKDVKGGKRADTVSAPSLERAACWFCA
jgi:hypothetical protein